MLVGSGFYRCVGHHISTALDAKGKGTILPERKKKTQTNGRRRKRKKRMGERFIAVARENDMMSKGVTKERKKKK